MALAQDSLYHRLQSMSSTLEGRPSSALARGVQITEFNETRVNPEPVVLEDSDLLLEQYLSPGKLKLLTGVQNLEDIRCLELKVDTKDTSLGNFGSLLPNLTQLKLSNSSIPCIRDLGSSLRNISVLWMSRCGLQEIDGISSMLSLKELYLSYNEICDISALSMLDCLQILDLEGNNIDDIQQVHHLAMCSKLTSLTLEGNPVCVLPTPDVEAPEDYDYRQTLKTIIPHLKYLDEEPLTTQPSPTKMKNVFDDDWAYLEELQKDVGIGGSTESLHSSGSNSRPGSSGRPGTASLRPSTGYRPGSALRPSSGFRPLTASSRPNTTSGGNVRPATAERRGSTNPESEEVCEDASSDLTMGKVVCGNPSKALISRRKIQPGQPKTEATELKLFPQFQHKPEHTYDPVPDDDKEREEIMAELKEWKKHHEKMMERIRAEKAPQVLVIDHDDAISVSSDEDITDEEEEDINKDFSPIEMPIDTQFTDSPTATHSPRYLRDLPSSDDVYESLKIARLHRGLKHDEAVNADQESHNSVPQKSKLENDIIANPKRPYPPIKSSGRVSPSAPLVPRAPPPSAVSKNPFSKSMIPERRSPLESGSPVFAQSSSLDRPLSLTSTRPNTARAVLSQPKFRRQLPQVPSLPSKPNFPK